MRIDDTAAAEPIGSAGGGLSDSLAPAYVWAIGAWQGVVIAGALTSPTDVPTWVLVTIHLAIGLLCYLGAQSGRWGVVASVTALAVAPIDLYACHSIVDPTSFATIWTMNVLVLGPVIAIRGWRGTAAGLATTIYAAVIFRIIQPEWTVLHGTMITTGVSMVVAGSVLTRYLHRFADRADSEAADASLAQHALLAARAAGRQAADAARTMHDTGINTLAAVATGGAATSDRGLVRDRCARDVTTLDGLLAGHEMSAEPTDLVHIGSHVAGIEVVRDGLAAAELSRLEHEVPIEILAAFRSAADEAVRNAARHSGAKRVLVTVRCDDALVVTVADDGVGFDRQVVKGRGLSESVMARAADVGAQASVLSSPGDGTTVTLRWRRDAPSSTEDDMDIRSASALGDDIRGWACWAWAVGVVTVGCLIEYAPRPGVFTETYVALAIVAAASLVSWWFGRTSPASARLPRWWSWVVVVLVPIVFVLGYLGVEDAPYLWQALCVTPLLVILLVHRRRDELWGALITLAATSISLAVVAGHDDLGRAGLVLVGTAPQIGLFAGWVVFYRVIGEVAQQTGTARRAAAASRSELVVRQAMLASRARWQEAGAERALGILRDLADGRVDPQDEAVRRRCAEEEQALRQVMQLSTEALHLGPWLARALAEARSRGVELTIRSGDVDAPGARAAEVVGRIVLDHVNDARAGARLTVGLFGRETGGQLVIVGSERVPVPPLPDGWSALRQRLGEQDLLEVTWS